MLKDNKAKIPPLCGAEPMMHRSVLTDVKTAIYIRVFDAIDPSPTVTLTNFDLTVRTRTGKLIAEIEEIIARKLFKVARWLSLCSRDLNLRSSEIDPSDRCHEWVLLDQSELSSCSCTWLPFESEITRPSVWSQKNSQLDAVRAVSSPKYTTIRGPDDRTTRAGRRSRFDVTVRDQEGNRRRKGGDSVEVLFMGPSSVDLKDVVDNADGTYSVLYRAMTHGWCARVAR